MQLQSNAQRVLIINDHRFTGYASEDRPIEYPSGTDRTNIELGQDGAHYGTTIPEFGGLLMIRLQPTSPSVQWCIQQILAFDEAIINGEPLTFYQGSESVPSEGTSWQLEGGSIKRIPYRNEPGQTFEAVFDFERIIPTVAAGRFNPHLTTV